MRIAGMTFPVGCLQYLNFNVEMYSPPDPDRELFAPGDCSSFREKLMNLELVIQLHPEDAKRTTPQPQRTHYKAAGHNLMPWTLTRKYHYAETAAGFPLWPSAPLELLWTDPDFVQTVG